MSLDAPLVSKHAEAGLAVVKVLPVLALFAVIAV